MAEGTTTILLTTPLITPHLASTISLDASDKQRLAQSPHLAQRDDWLSSRFLKSQLPHLPDHTLSLSHKQGHAVLICTASSLIGIDLEILKHRDYEGLAQFAFSRHEQQWLARQPQKKAAFYLVWTLKEALIKAKKGHLADLPLLEVVHKDEILIPKIHGVTMSAFSFSPVTGWLISGVLPQHILERQCISIKGYGLWEAVSPTLSYFKGAV